MNQTKKDSDLPVLNEELLGRKKLALALYIHVPFCSTTCDFCAFYQEKPSKKRMDSYFLGLENEISRFPPDRQVSTLFIGGGTPGLLKPKELSRLTGLVNNLDLSANYEWSVELAPSEITPEKLKVLKDGGVNRISMGVQTFNPVHMEALGRKHSVTKTFEAYQSIRDAGFSSVNLDLLFGAPGQSLLDWEKDLDQAVALQPDHLSTYCLTFEEDTAMYLRLSKGQAKIDPEREATFYEFAWEYLPSHGYEQYEISNYARKGHACLHNLNTWAMNEWIGYGPSACSQIRGSRRKNLADVEKWSHWLINHAQPEYLEEETLTSQDFARDAVLFGLRMNGGIKLGDIANRFDLPTHCFSAISKFFHRLIKEGLAEESKKGFIHLLPSGRILADSIACEVPELDPH